MKLITMISAYSSMIYGVIQTIDFYWMIPVSIIFIGMNVIGRLWNFMIEGEEKI